ncbi:MAG: toll/interleukin-1 receptor domain-containing protein [Sulfurovum sp.]|nr:toll/interleukin-1 receptor domain-containing protein [Sulfurovum sp.]
MKPIEKFRLIDKIAETLQQQMTCIDIFTYLPAFNISTRDKDECKNSKRIYLKELLANESVDTILEIADDLEIEHNEIKKKNIQLATFWEQGHFKLFISHLAKYKKTASNLQNLLLIYGISGFVAHEDIEPSKEWQEEIEIALHSMDALTAILMEGFKESNWCDQEVGFAVGKDVLIIPIRKEIDPYGFIGKYQAIKGRDTSVQKVAKSIFETIIKHPKTRHTMLMIFINLIANSTHIDTALKQLEILSEIKEIPREILEQMAEQIKNNNVLMKSKRFMIELSILLDEYNIAILNESVNNNIEITDEIPF